MALPTGKKIIQLIKKTKPSEILRILWPSLGSNQGLADYEKRTIRFHLLSFRNKAFDFIAVTALNFYFWFQTFSQKSTTCCTYVVLKKPKL